MKQRFKSLKVVLSSIVILIVAILVSLLVFISYNTAYSAVEKVYLEEMQNFNKDISTQLVRFYKEQVSNATFFTKTNYVVDAVRSGDYQRLEDLLIKFHKEVGIYENVFISTASKNPVIKVASLKESVGLDYSNKGFDDNIKNAIQGKIYVGEPYKSPVSGIPVILITVPIMHDNKIIGIFGLPCNIGIFANLLVKDIIIGKTGYPFITDIEGLAFAHPDEKVVMKLNVNDYDWGKQMLAAGDSGNIVYQWEGKDKYLSFIKNKDFKFISCSTIYVSDINEDARAMAVVMVIVGLVCILVSAFIIYLFISRRLKPLEECKTVMAKMAEGDLQSRYTGKQSGDEISDIATAMNNALDQFESLISEVIFSSENLVQAVGQISSGNQNLSQRTSEQASSLEEIASTIEQATAAINQNADNSEEARRRSEESSSMAIEGGKLVAEAVASINEMNVTSKKIGEIISVINEIAFQTNLLALNAAVEAARAGEQGRGFAVVAGEVRNLAQRSGNAAKEIGTLINNSIETIEVGTEKVNKSGEALDGIINSVKDVTQVIVEITEASREQKSGMQQINVAVTEMDNMTQQNAALVEETASASEEMANQAQELLVMMQQFSVSGSSKKQTGSAKIIHEQKLLKKDLKEKPAGALAKPTSVASHDVDKKTKEERTDYDTIIKSEGFEEF